MGYTTKLREDQLKLIEPITRRLEALKGGDSFAIQDTTHGVDQLRYLLYSYLYQMGIKPYFVVRRESPTRLRILRKVMPKPQIIGDAKSHKAAEFVVDNLLEIDDEAEALSIARAATNDATFMVEILEEWRRMRGEV